MNRIPDFEMSHVLARALREGHLESEEDSVLFYDLSRMSDRIREIRESFPESSIHAVAIKANPPFRLLKRLVGCDSAFEVASFPELMLALRAGSDPRKIIFDSPAKTRAEIDNALRLGVYLNADNPAEVARIAEQIGNHDNPGFIGLRINPQIGAGSIVSTSLASEYSKFGVPLSSSREEIIELFRAYPWLCGLHVHIGSQGFQIADLVSGVRRIVDLADDIDLAISATGRRVRFIDVGGGLSVPYCSTDDAPPVMTYSRHLRELVPELFSGRFTVITEFGRYVHANSGWVASRVEYVKDTEPKTVIIHVGADLFLRRAYNPDDWYHELSVADRNGVLRTGKKGKYAVAGPLCFASDFLSKSVDLPTVKEGDYIIVHDAGAYTLSMWSRYNSRPSPKVIGYWGMSGAFEILRPGETANDVLRFWGCPEIGLGGDNG